MLKFDIITIFPNVFGAYFRESIIKRAQEKGLIKVNTHNLRDYTTDKHKMTDDKPYGSGPGMVMMVEPIFNCLKALKAKQGQKGLPSAKAGGSRVLLLSPRGRQFNQRGAAEFAQLKQLILICGRYEGVDQRVADYLVDEELSIGDYILTGGELAAMVVVDALTRLVPGVIKKESLAEESFSIGVGTAPKKMLEYPQYTRPENFRGWRVPEILLSGNHQEIKNWRKLKVKSKIYI